MWQGQHSLIIADTTLFTNGAAVQDQTERILDVVGKALDASRSKDAVHLFVQSMGHGLAARQSDLLQLVVSQLGKARAESLIAAFARHTCMGCKRGLLLCEECKGTGVFGEGSICDRCIGLGAANCGFCAGSGWITYNYVPPGIRVPVVTERVKLAAKQATEAMAEALPQSDDPPLTRKELAHRLLELNRLMGAFDNALEVTRHPPVSSKTAASALNVIRKVALKASGRMERRIRQLLVLLVQDALARRERADSESAEAVEKRRARFYHNLAKSADFKRTCLSHVYLHRQREP